MYLRSGQPVVVVDHDGAGGAVAEAQEVTEDLADAGDVGVDLLVGEQLARLVPARRIADLGGAAAHQHDRAVARLLQPAQQHDLHQAADMQAVGRGIEADVGGDHARPARCVERRGVGLLMDVAALVERAQKIGFELIHERLIPRNESKLLSWSGESSGPAPWALASLQRPDCRGAIARRK